MWIIFIKEIRQLLRDRKTLLFTVLIPVFCIPFLSMGFSYVVAKLSERDKNQEIKYAIVGGQYAPTLDKLFSQEPKFRFQKIDENNIQKAIEDEKIKFVLKVPAGFSTDFHASTPAEIELIFNGVDSGEVTKNRVNSVVDKFNVLLRNEAMLPLKLNASQLSYLQKPVYVKETSTASQRARIGALVGGILPYFLLIVCLMAAMYPAIDLGAGEKESGTLETLLLAPIPRTQIVLGKFLLLFSVGLTSSLLMVSSLGVMFFFFGSALDVDLVGAISSISIIDLILIAIILIPTAAIFASILLAISIYSRNYKEAAGMMQPLMLLTLFPVILAMLPSVSLDWFWASVPLTNVALAMKEIVKGTLEYSKFFAIFFSTSAVAAGLLIWCRWWFLREDILFRN